MLIHERRARDPVTRIMTCLVLSVIAVQLLPANRKLKTRADFTIYGDPRDVQAYFHKRRECSWHNASSQHAIGYTHYNMSSWETETEAQFLLGLPLSQSLTLHTCILTHSDTEFSIIHRLGPFNSVGGYDWHRWQWSDMLESQRNTNIELFLTKAAVLATDEDHDIISYPPLHPHHWHLNTPTGRYWVQGTDFIPTPNMPGALLAQTHGDSSCHSKLDAFGCLFLKTEEGTGFRIKSGQLAVFGETNDVRLRNSPLLTHFIEVSATVSSSPLVRVAYFGFANRPWVHASTNFMWERTGSQKVPTDGESMHWKTMSFAHCLNVTSFWWHTHHQWVWDMLLFRASEGYLGLNAFHRSGLGEVVNLIKENQTVSTMRDLLMENHSNEYVCSIAPLHKRLEYVARDEITQGVEAGWYSRLVKSACPDMIIHPGSVFTLVALYKTVYEHPKITSKFALEHSNLLGLASRCMPQKKTAISAEEEEYMTYVGL